MRAELNGMQLPALARVTSTPERVTYGQLNVWNGFDDVDDPRRADTVLTTLEFRERVDKLARQIRSVMGAPDVVLLQEIENQSVLDALVATTELAGAGYRTVLAERADNRGIRNAVLYRPDRVRVDHVDEPSPATSGRVGDPSSPERAQLFARPSLVLQCRTPLGRPFVMVDNHFKSKLGGDVHEPVRVAQGAFIAGYVDALRAAAPQVPVVVAGDLNATPTDGAYHALMGAGRLVDTTATIDSLLRYSFIYRGEASQLDHLLVTPDLAAGVDDVRFVHVNSGTPERDRYGAGADGASDHDPLLATLSFD